MMKLIKNLKNMKKKLLSYIIAPLLVIGSGCSDFGDINENPNASVNPQSSALLTNALAAMGGSVAGGARFNAGLYCQYFSETQYTESSLYSNDKWSWSGEMAGNIYDLQNIININQNASYVGVARILKAYRFSILTDQFGDIPYFQALQGNPQPDIDAQEDVYNDLFKELKEGAAQIDDNNFIQGDIMFNSDFSKWRKFANSLRLILALRVSEVDAVLGEAQFDDVINNLGTNGGIFSANSDNAVLDFPGGTYKNTWFGIGADQGISDVMAGELNSTNDRRKFAYGKPNAGNTLVGVPYGLVREDAIAFTAANTDWSLILNDQFRQEGSEFFILSYADVLLARAEGANIGWSGAVADAEGFYQDAIEASWQQWGVYDATAYAAYIANPTIDLTQTAADAQKIAEQRWLTFYPNGPQGWSEWRRTGFPLLTPTPNAVNASGEIPVRIIFPDAEYTLNGDKLQIAKDRMGPDAGGLKDTDQVHVWWDVD